MISSSKASGKWATRRYRYKKVVLHCEKPFLNGKSWQMRMNNTLIKMEDSMTTMILRNIDEQLKARLCMIAAIHGRTMEEEAREILCSALSTESDSGQSLVASIRRRLELLGGVELDIPPRTAISAPVDFGE